MSRITTLPTNFSFKYFSNEDYEEYGEYLKSKGAEQRKKALLLLNLYAEKDRKISFNIKNRRYKQALNYLWIEYSYGGMINAIKADNSRNKQIIQEALKGSSKEKTLIISGLDNKKQLKVLHKMLCEVGVISELISDTTKASKVFEQEGGIKTFLSIDSLLSNNYIKGLTRIILAVPMSPKTNTIKYLRKNPQVKVIDFLDCNLKDTQFIIR